MTTTWHLEDGQVERYAAGDLTPAQAASAESHLMACVSCRARLAPAVDVGRLDAIFTEVLDQVDQPRPALLERLLLLLRVRPDVARLVGVTPALRGAWLLSVALVLLLAVLASHANGRGVTVFVALAPLLPLAGVIASFGPHTDPVYEIGTAAPFPALRLLLARALAVVVTTIVLVTIAAAGLSLAPWLAAAWLLPALALITTTMALATRFDPLIAGAVLAGLWLAAASYGSVTGGDPLLAVRAGAQLLALGMVVAATAALLLRRNTFTQIGSFA